MHLADWMERVDMREEIQEVYLHSFLFKLGVNLIAIFLPLYILDIGFGPLSVFLFFLAYYSVYLFVSWPFAAIAARLGYKRTSLLASPFILAFYIILRTVDHTPMTLYGTGILGGLAFNLYWMGMNPEVAESSHDDTRDEETGVFFSMPTLASLFSPLVGGLILAVYSFNVLFLVAAALIGASFLPFLFSREHHAGMEHSMSFFLSRSHLMDYLAYTGQGFHTIGKKVLWPLYLAVVIQGSVSIGGAGSLQALGGAAMSLSIGALLDEDNRARIIAIAAVLTALSFFFMSQIVTPLHAFVIALWNGLAYTAVSVPVYSRAMEKAEQEDYVEYFAFREIGLATGRVLMLLLMVAIVLFLEGAVLYLAGFTVIAAGFATMAYTGSRF
jgi:MFS family permease